MAINSIQNSFPSFKEYAQWRLSEFSSGILFENPFLRAVEIFSSFDGRCYEVLSNGDIAETKDLRPGIRKALVIAQVVLFPLTLLACTFKITYRWRKAYHILPSFYAKSRPMSFEFKLDLWALCEGGRSYDAAQLIKRAYREKSRSLNLDNFRLTSIPREIGKLKQLKSLSLNENRIASLPREIWELKHLEILNLKGNRLHSISFEIEKLSRLDCLDLKDNQLSEVPKDFWKLHRLTCLDLSGNYFKSIPNEVAKLVKLSNFYLSDNWLKELPFALGLLPGLTTLDLSRNYALRDIPLSLRQNSNLAYLNLQNTHVIPNSTILPAFERAQIANRRREMRVTS